MKKVMVLVMSLFVTACVPVYTWNLPKGMTNPQAMDIKVKCDQYSQTWGRGLVGMLAAKAEAQTKFNECMAMYGLIRAPQ